MKISIGKGGLSYTFQAPFPETTKCVHCGGEARVAFVGHETGAPEDGEAVCDLRPNGGKGDYWPHDACAVAVYLCRDCLEPTALFNQA